MLGMRETMWTDNVPRCVSVSGTSSTCMFCVSIASCCCARRNASRANMRPKFVKILHWSLDVQDDPQKMVEQWGIY